MEGESQSYPHCYVDSPIITTDHYWTHRLAPSVYKWNLSIKSSRHIENLIMAFTNH
jgi:hypothetical protein